MDETIEWREARNSPGPLSGPPGAVGIALGHGAGGNQESPVIAAVRDGLIRLGHPVVTFDYPYRTEGRKAPDRQAVLLECHRAVLERARRQVGERLVIGRVSMGGRMASAPSTSPPSPCPPCSWWGTATLSLLAGAAPRSGSSMARADVHLVEDADHSFRGRAGRSRKDMLDEVVEAAGRWLAAI